MTIPNLHLNDGHSMPQIGLGTASLNDDTVAPVIVSAIEAGYRHIDTAYRYGNQRGVGKGIRDSGIQRAELFVTTKLDGEFQGNDRAIAGLDACLRQLGLDYVDLLLIHWRVQLQACPSGSTSGRNDDPAGGQPDSAESAYHTDRSRGL